MAGLLELVFLIYCEALCCLFILCSLCSFIFRNKPHISFIIGVTKFIFNYVCIYIANKQNIIYVGVILFIYYNNTKKLDFINKEINLQRYEITCL